VPQSNQLLYKAALLRSAQRTLSNRQSGWGAAQDGAWEILTVH
jgi:hypothetical protein